MKISSHGIPHDDDDTKGLGCLFQLFWQQYWLSRPWGLVWVQTCMLVVPRMIPNSLRYGCAGVHVNKEPTSFGEFLYGIPLLHGIHSENVAQDVLAARPSTARCIECTKVHVTSIPGSQERRH